MVHARACMWDLELMHQECNLDQVLEVPMDSQMVTMLAQKLAFQASM